MAAVGALRDEWEDLAHRTGAPVFSRPGWLVVWQRHLVPDAVPELLVARDADGALVGVLPLARTSRRLQARVPLKVPYLSIAGAGTGSADHNGPVAVDDDVARALFHAAVDQARGATLYLENLSPRWAQLAQDAVGGTVTRLTECPAVERAADGHFSDAWSKKMGKNVRRRHRQMEEEGITSRWVPAGPDFPAALDQLRRVHEGRWNAQGGEGRMSDTRRQFLRDLADECRAPDVPWILLLEQGDRVVAGMLGIVAGSTFSVYKTGWDPDYARFSLGITMGPVAMDWAETQGLTTFDYLRGPAATRRTWAARPSPTCRSSGRRASPACCSNSASGSPRTGCGPGGGRRSAPWWQRPRARARARTTTRPNPLPLTLPPLRLPPADRSPG